MLNAVFMCHDEVDAEVGFDGLATVINQLQTFIPKMGHSIFAILTFCVESSPENVTHLLRQSQGH